MSTNHQWIDVTYNERHIRRRRMATFIIAALVGLFASVSTIVAGVVESWQSTTESVEDVRVESESNAVVLRQ